LKRSLTGRALAANSRVPWKMRTMRFARLLTLPLAVTAFLSACATANDLGGGASPCSAYDPKDGDLVIGGPGDDRLFGGRGIDIAFFSGKRSEYIVVRNGNEVAVIGPDGIDVIGRAIEFLVFDDVALNLFAVMSQPEPSGSRILQQIPVWGRVQIPAAPDPYGNIRNALLASCR